MRSSETQGGAVSTAAAAADAQAERTLSRRRVPAVVWLLPLGIAWATVVAVGIGTLWSYSLAQGVAAAAPSTWPRDSRIARADGAATLVTFAHPHCPCTKATIAELAKVMTRAPAAVSAHVVFARPAGVDANWERADLWHAAQRIPGVSVTADEAGAEARRFGVATSGQVLFYDARGRLKFAGGITGARGHEGANAGAAALAALVSEHGAPRDRAPVFGCALGREGERS